MNTIKRFDAYPKINEDFRVRHWIGGALSILYILCMMWMFYSVFDDYFTTKSRPVLRVDETKNQKIDVLDSTGDVNIDIESNIKKVRLSPLDRKKVTGKECPPCYDAETEEVKCCYSCEELIQMHDSLGKKIPFDAVQCKDKYKQEYAKLSIGEGCQMYGTINVNKVSGNFHIAPGTSVQHGEGHHHSTDWIGSGVNLTHTWNTLSFGEVFPGMVNPMDNLVKVDDSNNSMYQYFVQIVPMTYNSLDGTTIQTNGYSVTEHSRPGNLKTAEKGVPGVFVLYEFSSMEVLYYEEQNSLAHLLTSICGIIGGIFTVFSLLDAFIFYITSTQTHNDDRTN
ncbi:Endoplasmic reticulum-golgi intermediate compartment protein [Entamoeba marina]